MLLRGKVAVSTELEHRNIRISYAANGAILGLAENLGGHNYQTTVVAVTSVTVHFIPKEDLVSMIQDEPATGMHVLELLSNDLTTVYSLAKRLPERGRGIRLRRGKRQIN